MLQFIFVNRSTWGGGGGGGGHKSDLNNLGQLLHFVSFPSLFVTQSVLVACHAPQVAMLKGT